MTTNFTIRDFFVYLVTGITLIISISLIFFEKIFFLTIIFFNKYQFLNDFSFLVTVFIIPAVYILGHIIGSISYNLLQLYIAINNTTFFKRQMPSWKYFFLIKLQQTLYRQRIAYAISKYLKSSQDKKLFNNYNEFWIICAALQVEKIYAPAEYWYILNELFNSLNLIFFTSSIISFITGQHMLGIIYLFLSIFAFKRAKQYANHFIQTVCNLKIANTQNYNF